MKAKFIIGDKVVINGRCPQYILDHLRHNRLRTITAVYYEWQGSIRDIGY